MDQPCSYAELRGCLSSIATINRLTLAYRPTLHFLDQLRPALAANGRPLHLVDLGCGYGDLLRRIHRWAARHRIPILLTGIDLNADAIRAARESTPPQVATFHAVDAFQFQPPEGIDVIVTSLVMHHLEDAQIVEFLRWMEASARLGWFINDLHRQPLPYHLFRLLARLTTWHAFAKHDGAISILRSFRRQDWTRLLAAAGLAPDACTVRAWRPARLCVERIR